MAAPSGVEFTGLRELNAALKRLGVDDAEIKTAMNEAGMIVVREAWRLMPVASGKMARTLKANKSKTLLKVSVGNNTTVPYAYTFHAVALGQSKGGFTYVVNRHTRKGTYVKSYARKAYIPNKPFLFLAFERKQADLLNAYASAIDGLLQKAGQ